MRASHRSQSSPSSDYYILTPRCAISAFSALYRRVSVTIVLIPDGSCRLLFFSFLHSPECAAKKTVFIHREHFVSIESFVFSIFHQVQLQSASFIYI